MSALNPVGLNITQQYCDLAGKQGDVDSSSGFVSA